MTSTQEIGLVQLEIRKLIAKLQWATPREPHQHFSWGCRPLVAIVFSIFFGGGLVAGEFNSVQDIGAVAPDWVELPGVDGKSYSLKDFESSAVVVLVFTCNSCPYAVDYENRINDLAKKWDSAEKPVSVIAINSNKIEEDAMPAMQTRAADKKFVFPYLFDESQKTAKDYGAVRTPEFFVLNSERRIIYMGKFDDNTREADVKRKYVEEAIASTMEGTTLEISETPPVGCAIRFQRERRR